MNLVQSIRITQRAVALFAQSSHDTNPLHLSDAYANKTPYGRPVAFGALGALQCLAALASTASTESIAHLQVEFRAPIFPDADYTLEVDAAGGRVRLRDGAQSLLTATFQHDDEGPRRLRFAQPGAPPRASPRVLELADLDGLAVEAPYAPDLVALRALCEELRFPAGAEEDTAVVALLWASYLVGMEAPGRSALFSKLSLRLLGGTSAAGAPLYFRARVAKLDRRFSRLTLEVELHCGSTRVAEGTLEAFVREEIAPPTEAQIHAAFPSSERLAGKVALVVGGSRGLGASICHALARNGCSVGVQYRRSTDDAKALEAVLAKSAPRVDRFEGDAGDPSFVGGVLAAISERHGRLDYLVLSAGPPVLPMSLGPGAGEKIADYVRRSVALVSVPLAAAVDLLAASDGTCVTISSSYVVDLPAEFPQYVAAKGAIEGLVHATSRARPALKHLLVRPPKLRTDLTNSPLTRSAPMAPEVVAAAVVAALDDGAPGSVRILDSFG